MFSFKISSHSPSLSLSLLFPLCCCSLVKYDGDVWPEDGLQNKRVSRELPDTRHGSVSLIPLRGSENEMRNSVAAFSQDPLAVSQSTNHWEANQAAHCEAAWLIRDLHAEQVVQTLKHEPNQRAVQICAHPLPILYFVGLISIQTRIHEIVHEIRNAASVP